MICLSNVRGGRLVTDRQLQDAKIWGQISHRVGWVQGLSSRGLGLVLLGPGINDICRASAIKPYIFLTYANPSADENYARGKSVRAYLSPPITLEQSFLPVNLT